MRTGRPSPATSVRPRTIVTALVVVGLMSSACGTRLSSREANDQLRSAYGNVDSAASQDDGGGPGSTSGTGIAGGATSGTTGSGSTTGTSGTGGVIGPGMSGRAPTGSTGTGGSGTGGPRAGGSKAEIRIGMVGNFSGVIGAAFAPARDAYAAWVSSVNARGGIDGHPVRLFSADDGNSASNDLAQARRMVEDLGVVALVNLYGAAGGAEAVGRYAASKGIAVVGGSSFELDWTKHKTMFPLSIGAISQGNAWANVMKQAGKKKVAAIYCTEGQVCKDNENTWAKAARGYGLDIVYEGAVSLAQPDFTSACTQAQANGAEAVVTVVDGGSTVRFARDCDRQGYHPLIVNPNPTPDTPSYMEGVVAVTPAFPWFLTGGSPQLEEYAKAIKKYTDTTGAFTSAGWIAGKALEKALTGRVSATPRPQDVLDGMYAFKGETLGGLYPPGFTFTRGKNATEVKCGFKAVVSSEKWTAPFGTKPVYCA